MKKRKEKIPQERKLFSKKQSITISIALAAIIILGFLLSSFLLQNQEVKFSLKAAIIDQLGEEFPNPQFVDNVTSILEVAGFNVTHYESKKPDVNFFKGLAKYNYGIIILRVHSALRDDKSTVDLFTTEPFNEYAHVQDQNNGLLVMGILNYSQDPKEYFAITSTFIKSLEGTFPKSVVIAMGCWSLKPECKQMAEAFIRKGAEAYIGWTDMVDPGHTDNETVKLLRMLLKENKPIEEAVGCTSQDWRYSSKMRYHPESAGDIKISGLIEEAEASSNHQGAITLFEPILAVCIYNATPKIRRILNLAYVKLAC